MGGGGGESSERSFEGELRRWTQLDRPRFIKSIKIEKPKELSEAKLKINSAKLVHTPTLKCL